MRAAPPPGRPAIEDWRAWATRAGVAAALASVVGLGGAMAGIPWPEAAGAGSAAVGGWYVSLATHALARALAMAAAAWGSEAAWLAGPLASLPALGVWALAAGVTATIAGPPLLVFGVVSVLVANATFSAGALLRRLALASADGVAVPRRSPQASSGPAEVREAAAEDVAPPGRAW